MSNVTAESIAREFQQIKDEGYNPDIDEFLHHIPKNMRDDVRALIERTVESLPSHEQFLAQ